MNEDAVLVLIDVQERLCNVMHNRDEIIDQLELLVKGALILDMPILWLEQYPRGLGPTHSTLKKLLIENHQPIEKMTFSAYQTGEFKTALLSLGNPKIYVAGMESHICVYQTAADLLAQNYEVDVIIDCVSSRTQANEILGIDKMVSQGAGVTSLEALLFELMQTAEHPKFREISKLIK